MRVRREQPHGFPAICKDTQSIDTRFDDRNFRISSAETNTNLKNRHAIHCHHTGREYVLQLLFHREAENGVGMNRSARGGKCKAF